MVPVSGGSLQDRIAQVLAEHMFRITGESDQPTCCDCQEGRSGVDGWMLTMEPQEHAAHVAAAVLAALGLTEEWGATLQISDHTLNIADKLTEKLAREFGDRFEQVDVVHRWISPWGPA